ncbi:SCO family protein [Sphingomonas sp.]|uniref:SCO family protein n=1 Tax=Sphingomonas sp. TaxID=28214 RepID=UPI001D82D1DD|nr:SCO family protein [Sphingomonas sp.]MBX9795528.1 SCO family protein [Sphingomonas sp.]
MKPLFRVLPVLAAAFIASCSPGPAAQPPLAGAAIGGPFTLTDQHGKRVSDRDFAGKYRIFYFGYTFCPDVCPVDVMRLSAGLKALEARNPALGARVVPIFVSVDPARDTPARLKEFAANFHPRLVALTGSQAEIDAVARRFAVPHQALPPRADGSYLVDHGRAAYLFGPDGKPLAILPQDGPPTAIADDIERWAR